MTTLREAAQQALGALEKSVAAMRGLYGGWRCESALKQADTQIIALRAALAQQAAPETVAVQEQDIEDAIEAAYWHFDARKKGLNEWASAPQSERDAFKAETRKLVKGYFPTRQAQDTKREMLAVADAFIRGKRAALAQRKAEPVAWKLWDENPEGGGERRYYDAKDFKEGIDPMKYFDGLVPLYGSDPPQRKLLTDEEIDKICRQAHGGADPQEWARNFARAVERASWEKNHGQA